MSSFHNHPITITYLSAVPYKYLLQGQVSTGLLQLTARDVLKGGGCVWSILYPHDACTTSGTQKFLKKIINKTPSPQLLIDLFHLYQKLLHSKNKSCMGKNYYLMGLIFNVSYFRTPAGCNILGVREVFPMSFISHSMDCYPIPMLEFDEIQVTKKSN